MKPTGPCLFTTIRKANRSLFRFYQDALCDSKITIVQLSILRSLERKSPRSFPDLSDDLVLERTTLYRTIKPLIEMGAIEVYDAETGRTKHAGLTKHGKSLIDETMPHWERAQNQILNKVGSERWQEVSELVLELPAIISKLRR